MKKIILALFIGGIVVGSYFLINNYLDQSLPLNSSISQKNLTGNQADDAMMKDTGSTDVMEKDDAMIKEDQAMEKDAMVGDSMNGEDKMMKDEAHAEIKGYVTYSPNIVQQVAAQGRKPVLFFHATWCPTCKAADKDINSKLSQIPDDIVIIKTDYDTYTELKEKYGITYQHSFVQVDGQGNEITKWNGGALANIIDQVQ